jgi:dGTPase
MNWTQLLSSKRLGLESEQKRRDDRTEFQRDYDRLIFSAPFRRLQNKTQVFPLPGSIFVHNSLTHSLEVSRVGRSLGNDVSRQLLERHPELRDTHFTELGSIVSAACLAHDLGNPPFGHSGEKAIATFFSEGGGRWLRDYEDPVTGDRLTPIQWDDLTHFEGNANAFRLLTHHFDGRRPGGFVMTYSTLASIVKYPFSSNLAGKHQKFGFFDAEREDYLRIARELGIPAMPPSGIPSESSAAPATPLAPPSVTPAAMTGASASRPIRFARFPLVYLVEAADDICYEIMDLEDAHKLKIVSFAETSELMLGFFDEENRQRILKRIEDEQLRDPNEQIVYMRSCVIGKLENECVKAFIDHEDEILDGTFEGSLVDHISERQREAYKKCTKVSKSRIYMSRPVLDVELSGYKIMATLMEQMVEAVMYPERYYSQQLIGRVSSQYDIDAEDLETRLMAVIDYISGMTDVYALDVYQKINGISLPII